MKDLAKLTSELIFTLFLGFVLSTLFAYAAFFVFANVNMSMQLMPYVNFASGIIFGLIVGYKLRELFHKDGKKKKK